MTLATSPVPQQVGKNYRLRELQLLLGLSRNKLKEFCADGTFPNAWKPGKRAWRVPEGDVHAYIQRRTSGANQTAPKSTK